MIEFNLYTAIGFTLFMPFFLLFLLMLLNFFWKVKN